MRPKFILAVLLSSLVAFFLRWFFFGFCFPNYYEYYTSAFAREIVKKPPEIWAAAIADFAISIFLTWAIQKKHTHNFLTGFSRGTILAFLGILAIDFTIYAYFDIYRITFLLFDILVTTLFWGISGGIAGWILGIKGERERIKAYFDK